MKNLYITLGFLGWMLSLCHSAVSQNVKIVFDSAKVSKENKQIYIPYKIIEPSTQKGRYLYDISLRYSQNKGQTYSDTLRNVSKLGRDIGPALLPGSKTIIWDYYDENPGFDGQDVWFKLDVHYTPNPFALGGPEKALYSALLPGLGNTKVSHNPKYWYANTILSLGLIGAGLVYNTQSNNTYDKYLNAQTFRETQRLFDKSNNQRRTGRLLIIGGLVVWATDIARVAIKGMKNRRKQRVYAKRYPHLREKYSFNYGLDYDYIYQQPSFSLGIKF